MGEIMINEVLQTDKINTDADANIKGISLQKIRVAERLLKALLSNKKAETNESYSWITFISAIKYSYLYKNKKSQQLLASNGHSYTVGIYYNRNIWYAKTFWKKSREPPTHKSINICIIPQYVQKCKNERIMLA